VAWRAASGENVQYNETVSISWHAAENSLKLWRRSSGQSEMAATNHLAAAMTQRKPEESNESVSGISVFYNESVSGLSKKAMCSWLANGVSHLSKISQWRQPIKASKCGEKLISYRQCAQ
jgi:hypothetical protein